MSFCSTELNNYSTNIWQDIGSPTATSVGYIAAWLLVSGNLGRLNNSLDTSFWISGDSCISPAPGDDVLSIYEMIYKQQYYAGQQSALLTSISVGSLGSTWTRIEEGDSKISRSSPTEILKSYNASIIENNKQLRLAIGDFKRNNSLPQTVDAQSLYSYPTP